MRFILRQLLALLSQQHSRLRLLAELVRFHFDSLSQGLSFVLCPYSAVAFAFLGFRPLPADISAHPQHLSRSTWFVLGEQPSICKSIRSLIKPYPIFFIILEETFILFAGLQRQPLTIAMSEPQSELSFIVLHIFLIEKTLTFPDTVGEVALEDVSGCDLYAFSAADSCFEFAPVLAALGGVQTIAVRLSVVPVTFVVVVFSLGKQPDHRPFSMSFIASELSHIKVALLVYFHSHSISFIIGHLSLVNFTLGARNDSFSMSFSINYRPDIHPVVIESYLWSSKTGYIFEVGRIERQGFELEEVL